jgi:hypothetical protein
MRKEDGYIGARVTSIWRPGEKDSDTVGTIIDNTCRHEEYDFLVEFDDDIGGHDGLGWGNHQGKHGHCLWCRAGSLTLIEKEADYTDIEISFSFENLTE